MNCQNCDNESHRDIVPKKYGTSGKNLCIPCFNRHAFQWGDPYLCSRCSLTQLKMASLMKCHSCAESKTIDKILKVKTTTKSGYKNRAMRRQCLEQMKNKIYNENYKHLSKFYKLTEEENCPIMMCDIPEDLVKFCMNGAHTYEEIAAEAATLGAPQLSLKFEEKKEALL